MGQARSILSAGSGRMRRLLSRLLWRAPASFRRRRAAHLRLGRRGEAVARTTLQRLGLDILTTNFRTQRGEVDIVAREGAMLCFVEVKTRRARRGSRPADAVTPRKQQRIIRAAHRYLRELGWPPLAYRYDILEVIVAERRLEDIRYWPGAFTEEPLEFADRLPRLEPIEVSPTAQGGYF